MMLHGGTILTYFFWARCLLMAGLMSPLDILIPPTMYERAIPADLSLYCPYFFAAQLEAPPGYLTTLYFFLDVDQTTHRPYLNSHTISLYFYHFIFLS